MSSAGHADRHRWIGRPWVARVVRVMVYVVPFVASIGAAFLLSAVVPPAATWSMAVIRLIVIAACSTVVLYGADRATRRLLPLAALLDLTLVFPDEAPSRFKIALRTGGTRELEDRLVEFRQVGADEPARAAELLLGLVAELSKHDRLTRGHSERVRAYAQMIGDELGLEEWEIDRLRWAGLLHDVGKLEVPAAILNKPGRLTDEEFEIIKLHPAAGAALTAPLADWLGESIRAVAEHHERWDGGGYPNGLARDDISLSARIVAVADTFDVMTSVRSYQDAGSAARARQELADCAGTQFDPAVVRAFLSISLGKLRMAMGPLSWLTQLSLFPPGLVATAAAPTMTAVAGLAAAVIGVAASPVDMAPVDPPAFAAVVVPIDSPSAPVVPAAGAAPTSTESTEPVSAPTSTLEEVSDSSVPQPPATAAATTAAATTTTSVLVSTGAATPAVATTGSPAPTTVTTAVPTTVATATPVVAATTTTPATTTTVATTTTTTAATTTTTAATTTTVATTTTTTAATTTTVATTTTTTAATTTTSVPPTPAGLFLGASAAGDVAAAPFLPLVTRAPLNATLPNLDTDHDADQGRTLKKNGAFSRLENDDKIQRFELDPAGPIVLDGRAELVLYAAAEDLKNDDVITAVALVDCPDDVGVCIVFDSVSIGFTGEVDRFSMLTFDFGDQSRTIDPSRHLELWIIVPNPSKHDMWIAYDTIGYESVLRLDL